MTLATHDGSQWLKEELWRQQRRVMPTSIVLSMLLAALAAGLQWQHVPHASALAWLGLIVVTSVARLLLYRDRGLFAAMDHDRCLHWHRVGCLCSGIAWATSLAFLWAALQPTSQLLLIFVLAGVTAAAAVSLACDFPSVLCFELPVWAALVTQFILEGSSHSLGMAAATVLFFTFIGHSAWRSSGSVAENLALRQEAHHREALLQQSESRFRHLAQVDSLTGLANRYAMQAHVPALLSAAADSGTCAALLYIDLDDFKDVNDTRGHGCGDQLLQAVAERLRAAVPADDTIYRMGGDEFIVVTTRAGSKTEVERLAQDVLAALAVPLRIDGLDAAVGASIGIGVYPDDGLDVGTLLKHADVALYQAKAQGRGSCHFYSTGQSQAIAERLDIEAALVRAIDAEALFLEYQPLIDIASGAVVGFEALARWHHPERGLISPATFIGAAERCGRIHALGELVLRKLCRQLRAWQSELMTAMPVAINVSPRQFDGGRFLERFMAITAEHGIDPHLIEVEVTESALMSRGAGHHDVLDALRRHGVRISIDDFGTGHSCLSYLRRFPIDVLKIDRSFVQEVGGSEDSRIIIDAIISLAKSLRLETVAEGVETNAQLDYLMERGCFVAQGFLFGMPMPSQKIEPLLKDVLEATTISPAIKIPDALRAL